MNNASKKTARAFAPAAISSFFEIHDSENGKPIIDLTKMGARGGGFGVTIGGEGLHPPFATRGVGDAVVSELPGRRVNLRPAGAVSDGDRESHATVSGSGEILCKLCANILRIA